MKLYLLMLFVFTAFYFNLISLANPIQIKSEGDCAIEAGSIEIADKGEVLTVCVNDETLKPVDFNLVKPGNGENNKWIITDEDAIVQYALSEISSLNLYGVDTGTMKIWLLTWDGSLSASLIAGANATQIAENSTCAVLSSPVTIINDCCCPYNTSFTLDNFSCISGYLFPDAFTSVDTNLTLKDYRLICDEDFYLCSSQPRIRNSEGILIAGSIREPGIYLADGCDCSSDVFLEITQDFLDDCNFSEVDEDLPTVCNGGLPAEMPVVSSIDSSSATIQWNPERGVSLQYKAADTSSWTTPALTNGYVITPNLEPCKQYEVRLNYDCDSLVIASSIQRFTTSGCISCTDLNPEIALIDTTKNSVILSWDIISGSAYTLQYKTSDESTWQTYNTTIPFVVLFGLDECKAYEFGVTVTCPNAETSGLSNIVSWGKNCGGLKTEMLFINDHTLFNIYPNPAVDFIEISSINHAEISTIKIFNVSGELLFDLNPLSFSGFSYTASISELPKGLYILSVTIKEKMYSQKFLKE